MNSELLLRELADHGAALWHVRTNTQPSNATKGRVTGSALAAGVALVMRALGALLRHRPDVAYLNVSQNTTGFARDAVLAWLCYLAGVPVVGHIRGGNFGHFRQNAHPVFRRLIDRTVSRLAAVILLAERFRCQLDPLVDRDRQVVLYNAVDLGAFELTEKRGPVRVLFVGHLSYAKGFHDALQVADAVLSRRDDVVFEFAGSWLPRERNIFFDELGRPVPGDGAPLRQAWEELERRFPERCLLLGTVSGDRKRQVFERAHILLFPSYSEGFPTVVLEAMAAGQAVVATRVGALPEVLEDRVNGRLTEIGDVPTLIDGVLELAGDVASCRAIGRRNRTMVEERFALQDHAASVASVLRAYARRSGE